MTIPKLWTASVLVFFSLFTATASAATPEMYEQFDAWINKYIHMGILPTTEELRLKRESLLMDSDDAQQAYETAVQIAKENKVYERYMKFLNLAINVTIKAAESKSNGTLLLGKKMAKLISDSSEEERKRDVDGWDSTFEEIRVLAQKLADRNDAEETIERIRNGIPSGKSQSQIIDEQDIKSSLNAFYQNEADPDFMPKPWVDNFLATKVNPYITRSNTALANAKGGKPVEKPIDEKTAHDILD